MATTIIDAAPLRANPGLFEARMGTTFVLLAVAGFVPSYWLPIAQGTIDVPFVVHVHGALFFGWLLLFRIQAGLAAAGNFASHRALGWAGAVLAFAMPCAVFILQSTYLPRFDARGFHDGARAFAWINVSDMILFCAMVIAAIANVRRTPDHRRLMLSATASLMAIPIGRGLLVIARLADILPPGRNSPPPVTAAILPHMLSWLFILLAILNDRRATGKTPRTYIWTLFAMAVQLLTLAPIGHSVIWAVIADFMFL